MGKAHQSRGCSDLVSRRHHLHGRDLQDPCEGDLRQGRLHEGSLGLFNSSLEGGVRRGIDLHEGETIDEKAFKALIREAVALNEMSVRRK